uniref:Fukutin-related protein n=1 Tax=Cacopsylla melanoneura TaxID=428564 RepID=A0A8D8YTS3_9HEMI
MRLRVTLTKCTTITLTLINLLILYLLWTTQSANKIQYTQDLRVTTNVTTTAHDENELIISKNLMYKIIKKDITFMFRQYENYDNDLIASVASLRNMLPNSQIIILTDRFIYPVLKLNATIKIVKIMPSLENNYDQRNVISQVKTKYIMFLSDSLRFTSVQVFIKMIQQLQLKSTQIVSVNVARSKQCYNVNIDVKRWTLQFINQSRNICDYVESDKQMILVKKKLLHSLTDAFMQPFPSAFYIQTSYLKYKVKLLDVSDTLIKPGRKLFTNVQNSWKYEQLNKDRWKDMCKKLGFKKIIHVDNSTDWFGCRKNTPRCFGTVVNKIPQYIFEGKWTPPCCLNALRQTGVRVLSELENKKLRYWLLDTSLLGAFHMGDILPWSYHIDIGLYREDVDKSEWLSRSATSPITDDEGFIWERLNNGHLYRVQFSHVNRIHVNLYTYTLTNNTFMVSRYNTTFNKFYSSFITPLSRIKFIEYYVSAPNNIRHFLQLFFPNKYIDDPVKLLNVTEK